jgi:hypothetical protein
LVPPAPPVCRTRSGFGRDVDLAFQDLEVLSAALRAAARRTYAVRFLEIFTYEWVGREHTTK